MMSMTEDDITKGVHVEEGATHRTLGDGVCVGSAVVKYLWRHG